MSEEPANENAEPAKETKSPKAKKAITIYVPETTYKKLTAYTDGSEKAIGALATKCFSNGYSRLTTKKEVKIVFE